MLTCVVVDDPGWRYSRYDRNPHIGHAYVYYRKPVPIEVKHPAQEHRLTESFFDIFCYKIAGY